MTFKINKLYMFGILFCLGVLLSLVGAPKALASWPTSCAWPYSGVDPVYIRAHASYYDVSGTEHIASGFHTSFNGSSASQGVYAADCYTNGTANGLCSSEGEWHNHFVNCPGCSSHSVSSANTEMHLFCTVNNDQDPGFIIGYDARPPGASSTGHWRNRDIYIDGTTYVGSFGESGTWRVGKMENGRWYSYYYVWQDDPQVKGGMWDLRCDSTTGNKMVASGWTCDPYNVNTPNDVHLYIDGPANPGVIRGINLNNETDKPTNLRYDPLDGAKCALFPDTCNICGGNPFHKFEYTFPDGDAVNTGAHTIYHYGQPLPGSTSVNLFMGTMTKTCPTSSPTCPTCNATPGSVRQGEPVTISWSGGTGTVTSLIQNPGATISNPTSGIQVLPSTSTNYSLMVQGIATACACNPVPVVVRPNQSGSEGPVPPN